MTPRSFYLKAIDGSSGSSIAGTSAAEELAGDRIPFYYAAFCSS
jgi:hypothetical protein